MTCHYPVWDAATFHLPGVAVIMELTAATALKATRSAQGKDGGKCGCCGQHVQVYRRSVYKRMAECLLWLVVEHRDRGGEWVSLKSGPIFRGGDNTKLMYWKLIERHPVTNDLYRPTPLGVAFARRQMEIPKYAYVYDGEVLGFSKETVGIVEACGDGFDFGGIGLKLQDWKENHADNPT